MVRWPAWCLWENETWGDKIRERRGPNEDAVEDLCAKPECGDVFERLCSGFKCFRLRMEKKNSKYSAQDPNKFSAQDPNCVNERVSDEEWPARKVTLRGMVRWPAWCLWENETWGDKIRERRGPNEDAVEDLCAKPECGDVFERLCSGFKCFRLRMEKKNSKYSAQDPNKFSAQDPNCVNERVSDEEWPARKVTLRGMVRWPAWCLWENETWGDKIRERRGPNEDAVEDLCAKPECGDVFERLCSGFKCFRLRMEKKNSKYSAQDPNKFSAQDPNCVNERVSDEEWPARKVTLRGMVRWPAWCLWENETWGDKIRERRGPNEDAVEDLCAKPECGDVFERLCSGFKCFRLRMEKKNSKYSAQDPNKFSAQDPNCVNERVSDEEWPARKVTLRGMVRWPARCLWENETWGDKIRERRGPNEDAVEDLCAKPECGDVFERLCSGFKCFRLRMEKKNSKYSAQDPKRRDCWPARKVTLRGMVRWPARCLWENETWGDKIRERRGPNEDAVEDLCAKPECGDVFERLCSGFKCFRLRMEKKNSKYSAQDPKRRDCWPARKVTLRGMVRWPAWCLWENETWGDKIRERRGPNEDAVEDLCAKPECGDVFERLCSGFKCFRLRMEKKNSKYSAQDPNKFSAQDPNCVNERVSDEEWPARKVTLRGMVRWPAWCLWENETWGDKIRERRGPNEDAVEDLCAKPECGDVFERLCSGFKCFRLRMEKKNSKYSAQDPNKFSAQDPNCVNERVSDEEWPARKVTLRGMVRWPAWCLWENETWGDKIRERRGPNEDAVEDLCAKPECGDVFERLCSGFKCFRLRMEKKNSKYSAQDPNKFSAQDPNCVNERVSDEEWPARKVTLRGMVRWPAWCLWENETWGDKIRERRGPNEDAVEDLCAKPECGDVFERLCSGFKCFRLRMEKKNSKYSAQDPNKFSAQDPNCVNERVSDEEWPARKVTLRGMVRWPAWCLWENETWGDKIRERRGPNEDAVEDLCAKPECGDVFERLCSGFKCFRLRMEKKNSKYSAQDPKTVNFQRKTRTASTSECLMKRARKVTLRGMVRWPAWCLWENETWGDKIRERRGPNEDAVEDLCAKPECGDVFERLCSGFKCFRLRMEKKNSKYSAQDPNKFSAQDPNCVNERVSDEEWPARKVTLRGMVRWPAWCLWENETWGDKIRERRGPNEDAVEDLCAKPECGDVFERLCSGFKCFRLRMEKKNSKYSAQDPKCVNE
ncbi:hypothetical protein BDZ89DRAFT_1052988 [Hymenopellis radicata]|nr:hypothetical protein BDZ89DRAFT_1052988 [Hymenopellis radicata]